MGIEVPGGDLEDIVFAEVGVDGVLEAKALGRRRRVGSGAGVLHVDLHRRLH